MAGKILILGGGFGGVRAALDLERKLGERAEITLIDRNGYHTFVPALYEAASTYISQADIFSLGLKKTVAIPFSEIFAGRRVQVVQSEIQNIDLNVRLVSTKTGLSFPYDYLVLGLGSDVADFGIPGVREYAFQFKTIEDAALINRHLKEFYTCPVHGKKSEPMKILIAGAGFSGIELAAELALAARKIAQHCGSKSKAVQVYLFEAQPQFLPQILPRERATICRRLTELGIVLLENSPIESVQGGMVVLKTGRRFTGEMVIWTAGIVANRSLDSVTNLNLSARGKIIVDEYLRLPNYRNVFAVGDNIEFFDHATQKPIPSLAYLAIDHGQVVAQNIVRSIEGGELRIHKPFYDTWIAPIGGKWAVAHIWRGITFSGFIAWIMREVVDLRYFLTILPLKKAISFFFNEIRVFSKND